MYKDKVELSDVGLIPNLETDLVIPEVNSIEEVLLNMGVINPLSDVPGEPFTEEGMDAYCRLQGILMYLQDQGVIKNLDFDAMDELSGFVFDKKKI